MRVLAPLLTALLFLAACSGGGSGAWTGVSGFTAQMHDGINAARKDAGLAPVRVDAALSRAAAAHSRDMSIQDRPWDFGSDGSSPIDRVKKAGYAGRLVGEAISETFEDAPKTLKAWLAQDSVRQMILSPDATAMGLGWYREASGKYWWTLVLGRDASAAPAS